MSWQYQPSNDTWQASLLSTESGETITREITYQTPIKSAPPTGYTVWITDIGLLQMATCERWQGSIIQKQFLQRGLVHATQEAALNHAKALIGECNDK